MLNYPGYKTIKKVANGVENGNRLLAAAGKGTVKK